MDERRRLALMVLEEGWSLSAVAREFVLSRPTARLWVRRAREEGLAEMRERSRRPKTIPNRTAPHVVDRLLAAKDEYPFWGAKKLLAVAWRDGRAPLCLSTANRILKAHGRVGPACEAKAEPIRFERERANEMWQADFKGMGTRAFPYRPLSIIDDSTRFCIAFRPVRSETAEQVWNVLWELFGKYGLPESLLTDNGAAFASTRSRLPGRLDAMLWRLGIRTCHGRPYHPQTQGKVERFHRTVQQELGDRIRQPTIEEAEREFSLFRDRYNWLRPHEAVGMRAPGAIYTASKRARPSKLPSHEIPESSEKRKVDPAGIFTFRMRRYRAGHGLAGQYVEIREDEQGRAVLFAGFLIGRMEEMKVERMC
ncbi:MAG: IS481 family transposase [Armatimonadetes bacterium]|nr:IS481 family transposase [Armatimonadota bacterium]